MLKQLHINHIGIEKMRTLACQSIYFINVNANIEETIKNYPTYLEFQTAWPSNKVLSHNILGRLWESVRADIFIINSMHHLWIVDFHSKLPVIKWVGGFGADNLIKHAKLSFLEYKLPIKIVYWHGHKPYFREVWEPLHEVQYMACSIIIVQLTE